MLLYFISYNYTLPHINPAVPLHTLFAFFQAVIFHGRVQHAASLFAYCIVGILFHGFHGIITVGCPPVLIQADTHTPQVLYALEGGA